MRRRLTLLLLMLAAAVPAHAQVTLSKTQQATVCGDLGRWTSINTAQRQARQEIRTTVKCPGAIPPPSPGNCVVSAWSPWSAWMPVDATTEQRTQSRTVVTPATNGGTPCPALMNTETRAIVVTPPPPAPGQLPPPPPVPVAGAKYIGPLGSDSAGLGTANAPYKTFAKLFAAGGCQTYVLLDGTYGATQGTGWLSYEGTGSAQVPSCTGGGVTTVTAANPGKVFVNGQLFIGRSDRKDSRIVIDGISFDGGSGASAVAVYNSSFVTIRNGGFHSTVNDGGAVFDVGTNDGNWGNTDNLFEDIWVWGKARIIVGNYRADRTTWRRVVVRGDGCSSADCAGSGNPNVGITVYDSQGVTVENPLVMDRQLVGSGNSYGDFAVAQHTPGLAGGNNMWLGPISINAPDVGFYMEPDQQTINPSNTLINAVAWNSAEDGMSIARSGQAIVQNATLKPRSGAALYFGTGLASGSKATTVLALSGGVSGVTVSGLSTSDPAMLYPLRSALGATVEFRYQDRVLTTTPLWPWQNEARIKAEMCATSPRGFCGDTSLTHYIWNQMGHGSPY